MNNDTDTVQDNSAQQATTGFGDNKPDTFVRTYASQQIKDQVRKQMREEKGPITIFRGTTTDNLKDQARKQKAETEWRPQVNYPVSKKDGVNPS